MEFGGRLRAARERRGISLRQVAASTKIPTASLEALERDDVARLPEGIFRRAIVRAYAAEIGLPPEETLREFLAHHEPQPPEVQPDDEGELVDARQRMAAVVVGVVVLSVLLAAAILLLTSRREPHINPPAAAVSAPAPQPADDGTGGDEEHLDPAPAPATDVPGAAPGIGEASRIE